MKTKQERSEIFKEFQTKIKKRGTFDEGKKIFLAFRDDLSAVYEYIFSVCDAEDFCKMPIKTDIAKSMRNRPDRAAPENAELAFLGDFAATGGTDFELFRCKTIAYYIFHTLRIEDIVSNTLIAGREQLFFSQKINFPIITTGNEIENTVELSKKIDARELKNYTRDVLKNTNEIIQGMCFEDSKIKVSEEKKAELIKTKTVSEDENAFWLVDYWCKKTYGGLLLMPFSRHHLMHFDACFRILAALRK